jgi:2-phospho-L-lactate/phosphoenolpyruvate guanylyltransferase
MDTKPEWAVVIPVKRLSVAKTRLTRFAGNHRAELALAFAADTVAAVAACDAVREVVVVTDDDEARELMHSLGCTVVADGPDAGLNPALVHGARTASARWPELGIAAVSSDLPALRPNELLTVLNAAAQAHPSAFVADAEGIGTTVLTADDLVSFVPKFGRRSRAEHRAAGVIELQGGGIASVRRDVDTEVQLYDAQRLGLGSRTTTVLDRLSTLR